LHFSVRKLNYKAVDIYIGRTTIFRGHIDLQNLARNLQNSDLNGGEEKHGSPIDLPSFLLHLHLNFVFLFQGVPVSFCRNYLPDHDVRIELEDEDGHIYDTKYLARKEGLSGGWHEFVVQHDLKVSDAVVFQLVGPTRFKESASQMLFTLLNNILFPNAWYELPLRFLHSICTDMIIA
jgi:hypothetical protein